MKPIFTLLSALFLFGAVQGQTNYWADVSAQSITLSAEAELNIPAESYRALQLDFNALRSDLAVAPKEFTAAARTQAFEVELPLPNGQTERFAVVSSPVLESGIASRYPSIRTYKGYSVDRPQVTTRFSTSMRGFHALISTPEGAVFIDPYARGQVDYCVAYYSKDAITELEGFQLECGHEPSGEDVHVGHDATHHHHHHGIENRSGAGAVSLRVYTFGLTSSGEYAEYHQATTVAEVLTEMVQIVNRCNEVLERDVAVRLVIADETENAIFLDPDNDPFSDGSSVFDTYGQTPDILNQYIGPSNYDVGHSFIANCGAGTVGIGGGNACNNDLTSGDYKGFGISCQFAPNNSFAVGLVCHEVGHQLSATHTFNLCIGNEENATPSTAYEPGGGTTIMSYTNACGNQSIQSFADDYYHTINVQQMTNYTQVGTGNNCPEVIPTDNTMPMVTLPYENGFHIPINTPFQLTAEGSDPENDDITYCWEQFDLGPATPMGSPMGTTPLFRSFPPTPSPTRIFPRLQNIVNNIDNVAETLPPYTRVLTFRCTVRDNNPEAGGTSWQVMDFNSDGTAGPFLVTAPNAAADEWEAGDYTEVTWDVANTTNPRVNCKNVNILLSTDGGFTYPFTLATNTPNDGSAFVSVPNISTSQARVRVEAADNIFFDISNENFEITAPTEPGYSLTVTPDADPLYCVPAEALAIDITTESLLDYSETISLSVSGDLPGDATATFDNPTLVPGESTTLFVDMGSFTGRDTFELQVEGTTADLGTFSRDLYLIVVSTDFTGFALLNPPNGTDGIILTTGFEWTDISGADSYDIEIATNAGFGSSIVEAAQGLEENTYTPDVIFEDGELYYWRVRPVNECGPGPFLTPFAFHTTTVDCAESSATDTPISIPTAPNTKISTIFIAESGTISDLNIGNVNINYNPVNSLRISLEGPDGTEVVMFDNNCLNTGLINIGFDDEAPTNIQCPPINGNPVRPVNPLSEFIGKNTQGEWNLKVQVTSAGFGVGNINGWVLEFCASASPEDPITITNEPLRVPPGQSNPITTAELETTDNASSPSLIHYRLVEAPVNGDLIRFAVTGPLEPGDFFTQATINAFNLTYVHDGSDTDEDSFIFVVEDDEGGWIPNQTFEIIIDENAPVNTQEQEGIAEVELFPNPARELTTLYFDQALSTEATLRLLNVQGQVLQQRRLPAGINQQDINTKQLPAGVYWAELTAGAAQRTLKLIVQR